MLACKDDHAFGLNKHEESAVYEVNQRFPNGCRIVRIRYKGYRKTMDSL